MFAKNAHSFGAHQDRSGILQLAHAKSRFAKRKHVLKARNGILQLVHAKNVLNDGA